MGYPELNGSTMNRPQTLRASRTAPHRHGPVVEDDTAGGDDNELVALAIALQDGCQSCVEHHASEAGRQQVPRRHLLDALGTALLLSTPHADRWPRLAEAALDAHDKART